MPASIEPADAYRGYDAWKGWDEAGFMRLDDAARALFAAETAGIALRDEPVLELGFGSGQFLAFARERGARVHGTEVSAQGRALASAADIPLFEIDLSDALAAHPGGFALIAAFDVMEHLTMDECRAMLDRVAALLRPGGYFVARFPNGQSPLGRLHQHSDITHRTILSAPILSQMIAERPFHIVRAGNSAVPISGSALRRAGGHARALARRLVEAAIARLYGTDAPLGPNLTVVLQRIDDRSPKE